MKNTVMVPLVFFLNLLLWIVVLSFFSVFASYDGMTTLTSGSVSVFCQECLYRSVYYFPLSLSLALVVVFFFLVRHKTIPWITALAILALMVACVFLVMPLSYRVLENNTWSFVSNRSELSGSDNQVFSPHTIRPDSDSARMVWYSVHEAEKKVVPLLVARPRQSGAVLEHYAEAVCDPGSGGLMSGDRMVVTRATGPDPLFLPVFTPPPVVALASKHINRVMDAFFHAFRQGFVPYTLFSSSFFISIVLIWMFCHASGWRLLNILFAVSVLMYLFGMYTPFSRGPVYSLVRQLLPSSFSSGAITALLYLLQASLMALVGIFVFIRRLVRHERRG